jgi:hypothetical protein
MLETKRKDVALEPDQKALPPATSAKGEALCNPSIGLSRERADRHLETFMLAVSRD